MLIFAIFDGSEHIMLQIFDNRKMKLIYLAGKKIESGQFKMNFERHVHYYAILVSEILVKNFDFYNKTSKNVENGHFDPVDSIFLEIPRWWADSDHRFRFSVEKYIRNNRFGFRSIFVVGLCYATHFRNKRSLDIFSKIALFLNIF